MIADHVYARGCIGCHGGCFDDERDGGDDDADDTEEDGNRNDGEELLLLLLLMMMMIMITVDGVTTRMISTMRSHRREM